MSDDNIALVTDICRRWSRGDLEATLDLIGPDARWEPSGRFIGSGEVYRGHEGIQKFWEIFREPWTEISLEPVEFTPIGESLMLTRTHFRGEGRSSGLTTETELFVLWTIDDGKLTGYRSFADEQQAREAAGLRSSAAGGPPSAQPGDRRE